MDEHPLHNLQKHDLENDRLNKEMKKMRERLGAIEVELKEAQTTLNSSQEEDKNVQVKIREVEGAIDTFTKQKSSSEEKILKVTSAKQLDALKAQIESLGEKIEEAEGQLLELYEQQESTNTQLEKAKEALVSLEKSGADERAEIGLGLQKRESEIVVLSEKRPQVAEAVEKALLSKYESIHDQHGGRVVLDIEDMACPGCGMALPRQDFEKMKAHREDFFDCNNCGRLVRYVGI